MVGSPNQSVPKMAIEWDQIPQEVAWKTNVKRCSPPGAPRARPGRPARTMATSPSTWRLDGVTRGEFNIAMA